MIDSNSLPEQFPDVPTDLSRIDAMCWRLWMNGHTPSDNELTAPSTKALYGRYREQHGRNDMRAAIADKLRAEASIRRIAMQNPNRVSMKQAQVTQAVRTSLDVYHTGETKPAIAIVRDLLPGRDVKPVMSRPQQRKRMKKALKANAEHPAVITAQKQGNPIRMDADTLSSGLMSLQNAALIVRKLNDHEQRLNDMEARMRELEAFKANTEKRHVIQDAGQDPAEIARSMRAAGESYGKIAAALGRSRSTIQRWVG